MGLKSTLELRVNDGGSDALIRDVTIRNRPTVVELTSSGVADMDRMQGRRVGYCIYCGATDGLTREHIVAFGLSGTAVLGDASCPRCREETSAFEAAVLRGPMRNVRVLRRLRSRSKHSTALQAATLEAVRNGAVERVQLPLEQFPILLPFPTFEQAGYLTGKSVRGVSITGVLTVSFGANPEAVLKQLRAQSITIKSAPDHPVAFARMIAKIAYSMAAARGATARLEEPAFVLPAIRGQADDIGTWVGTLPVVRKTPGLLHKISIIEDPASSLLRAEVQLFADSEAPTYEVIIGKMRTR
jgi:hypothetical protein